MPHRKLKAKKYNGVYEYYKKSDPYKATTAYYIGYRDEFGKNKLTKTDATNKDEALIILNQTKADVLKKKNEFKRDASKLQKMIQNKSLSLHELSELFFENRNNIEKKNDEKKYENHIQPFFKNIKVEKITSKKIEEFQEYLTKKTRTRKKRIMNKDGKYTTIEETVNLSIATVKDIVNFLRVMLNFAERKRYITSNPFSGDKAQQAEIKEVRSKITNQAEDTEPGRVLSDSELEKLWNLPELAMNDRLYLFLKTCYFTGARPAGVIDIQVKHIDFETKKIRIRAMKKGSSYQAKVNDELLFMLKEWIRKHQLTHNNFIFYPIQSYMRAKTKAEQEACKNRPANYAGYQRLLRQIFDPVFNVGIDSYDRMYRVTVYTMRRTAATKVYKEFGIVHAKNFLNHSDIKTTMHYLNIKDDLEDIDYGL